MIRLYLILLILVSSLHCVKAQPPSRPGRPAGIQDINKLPDGYNKLNAIFNFTRNPNNFNQEGEKLLNEGIIYARNTDSLHFMLPMLLSNQAIIHVLNKKNKEAAKLLDEALTVTNQLSDTLQADPLSRVASGYSRLPGHAAKANTLFERHNQLTKGKTDTRSINMRISNLQNQSNVLHLLQQYSKLRLVNKEVMELATHINNPDALYNIKLTLASSMISADQNKEATQLLKEIMPSIERNVDGRANRYFEIMAQNAWSIGDLPQAADFYTRIQLTGTANPQQRLQSAGQLVKLYIALNKADSVKKYMSLYTEIEKITTAHYNPYDQKLILASYNYYKGDTSKAKIQLLQNIASSSTHVGAAHPAIIQSLLELASIYTAAKQIDSATYYLTKVEKFIKQPGLTRQAKNLYAAALSTVRQMKNDDPATSLRLELEMRDSMLQQESVEAFAELESKYQLHQKEQEIKLAMQQQEINKLALEKEKQKKWSLWLIIGALGVLIIGIIWIISLQRKRTKDRHYTQLQQLEQQHTINTTVALRSAEEDERKKIAHKLHDEVGAMLSIARLHVDELQDDVFAADSDASTKLQATRGLLSEIGETVRSLSHSLMPVVLEKYGLKAAILDLLAKVNITKQLKVEQVIEGLDNTDSWNKELCLGLYRILQEVINNIIKHSSATNILVQVVELENSVSLYIEDNGKGIDKTTVSDGMGLKLIKSNIEYLNGVIEVNSQQNKGTFVLIELPVSTI